MPVQESVEVEKATLQMLEEKATQLRIDSVESTTAAGSGHPTSCASAADLVASLFFSVMRYDPKNPHDRANDVFVLSKGHAAPLLYAAWSEAGYIPREKLLTLRKIDSDLEGHPTPKLPFVDAATGSLGQGLSVGVGIAINAKKLEKTDQRVYVLMGDGESAEGSIWEAAQTASFLGLSNLCAIIDINRLGQSRPTMLQHHLEIYQRRWEAFGWNAIPIDGHNFQEILDAFEKAKQKTDRPSIILAKTFKGRGLEGLENADNWHGKVLDKDAAAKVIEALKKKLTGKVEEWKPKLPAKSSQPAQEAQVSPLGNSPYAVGGKEVAPRKAFGDALAALAKANSKVVAIDGDVGNSTYTEEFEKAEQDHFFESYIAEQNMVGMAMGLAARGKIPFASTFACFFSRAYDFARMAAISHLNIKLAGTHAGISIGEDGPSQMGLEDLAMFCAQPDFTVLYPSDATSSWKATGMAAERKGPCYLRLGRPNAKILYSPEEQFEIGKLKVLREGHQDKAVIVAGGVTLFEALEAYEQLKKEGIETRVIDLFSVQPIDREGLIEAAHAAGKTILTVEDHYEHGGLGDAVASAVSTEAFRVVKLAVREIPHSGKPAELLQKFGISASHIVEAVKKAIVAS